VKIFAGGISVETNTFSPIVTGLQDFQVQRGVDASSGHVRYPTLDLSESWGKQAREGGDDFVFSLNAWAQPGGLTVRTAYEALRDELLSDLRSALPVDVVLLTLHGAMVADGYDDCEKDIISRVRAIVSATTVIGVLLDLHCHLSEAKIAAADLVVTLKEYPHVDGSERARELFDLAIETKQGKIHPKMALFDCQMVGLYPTTRMPMRTLVDDMIKAERSTGMLSLSLAHGFQYADLPHVGTKVLAVADGDAALAEQVAKEFGLRVYGARHDIELASLSMPMEVALARATASTRSPVVVADQSDNCGGGAPGDATYALHWLLEHGASGVAMAIFYDPGVVALAKRAGQGAKLSIRLGGKMGRFSGSPLDLEVTVTAVRENYNHEFPQRSGNPQLYPIGDVAALRCQGIDIVVASERTQCFAPSIFTDLHLDPRERRVLVVKSVQHFYGAFAPIAAEIIYMAAPGAVAPDPRLINYRRLDTTRLYPWAEDPLTAKKTSRS
jgi:microcystin degradation protein MlrC